MIQELKDTWFKDSPPEEDSFFPVHAITLLIVLQCVKSLVVGNLKQTIVLNGLLGLGYLYRFRSESRSFGDLIIPSFIKLVLLFFVNNPYLVTSVGVSVVANRQQGGRLRSALLTLAFVLICIYYNKRSDAKELSEAKVSAGRKTIKTVMSQLPRLKEYPVLLREGLQLPPEIGTTPVAATCVLVLATLLHSKSKADATMLQVLTRSARSLVVP